MARHHLIQIDISSACLDTRTIISYVTEGGLISKILFWRLERIIGDKETILLKLVMRQNSKS